MAVVGQAAEVEVKERVMVIPATKDDPDKIKK